MAELKPCKICGGEAEIYSIGIEYGYEELVGVFTSEESLSAAKREHKRRSNLDGMYSVDEIELDTIINYDMCSW